MSWEERFWPYVDRAVQPRECWEGVGYMPIAREFRISKSLVWQVVKRKVWKQVP
jgi:Mor family transcriptional regulator